MQQGNGLSSRLKPGVAATLALMFTIGLTAVAFIVPVHVQFYVAYVFPIFLCAWTRSRTLLWGLTIFCIGVVLVRVIVGWPPPTPFREWFFFVNRAIAILTLLARCGVAHRLIRLI